MYIGTEIMTGSFSLAFALPGSGEHMTVSLIHVSGVGKNFPCNAGLEAEVAMAAHTTQMSTVDVALGVLTNTGKGGGCW